MLPTKCWYIWPNGFREEEFLTSANHKQESPCKSNRPKERAKILDDFDHCVIKRTIHAEHNFGS